MSRRALGIVTVALAAVLAVAALRLRGPEPLSTGAPADRFSAGRAVALLRDILREEIPHPVGSPANRVVRDAILQHFRRHGYETAVQREFVCNATPACATVENILATPPGDQGPWITLVAHYDSVAAGPGATDDGVGVAVQLEIARALAGTRGVAFLVTDGEEAGLLGAEAFVASTLKDRVKAIVNVENRGTSGPSFLFETSRGNAGLVPAMREIPRPHASSLFYTIYELLPNDTDVTVFKRAGLQAMNFGAIGNVAYYHTPLDDLDHVEPRTVQHHGDNALAVVRALQKRFEPRRSNAVFFDVLNVAIVSWAQHWTLWIALSSLALLFIGGRDITWRTLLTGAALMLAALVLAAATAFALVWLAHLRAGEFGRIAAPQPAIVAMWAAGIASVVIAFAFAKNHDARGLYAGVAIVWHAVAIALASSLPGTAYLFLLPAVAMSVSVALRARPLIAALAGSIAAAIFFFPLILFLYPALGKTSLLPIALLVALVATIIVPLAGRSSARFAALVVLAAVAAAAASNAFPVFTAEKPRRHAIEHELAEPTIDSEVERTGDNVTLRVSSSRDADRVMLDFDRRVDIVSVNGVTPAPPNPGRVWRGALTVFAPEAVVELRAPAGVEVTATDLTYGLPPELRMEAQQRNASRAVTTHRGDVTLSRRKLRI